MLPVFSRLLASVVSEVAEHSVLDVLYRFDHQLVDHLEPDLGHDQEHALEDELVSEPEHGLGHGLEHHFECLKHSLSLAEQALIVWADWLVTYWVEEAQQSDRASETFCFVR